MYLIAGAAIAYIISGVLTWKAISNLSDEEYEVVVKALQESRNRDIF
jgi:hypothetical protein